MNQRSGQSRAMGNGPARTAVEAYEPRPLSEDPGVHVPVVSGGTAAAAAADLPIWAQPPADAPAQTRPEDLADPRRPRLFYLSRFEFRVLERFCEVIVRPSEGFSREISPAENALNIDRYLAVNRNPMRLQIKLALHILNLWAVARGRLPWRWASERSRMGLAQVFTTNRGLLAPKLAKLKNLVYLCYYGDPRTDVQTGFTPVLARARTFGNVRRRIRKKTWGDADTPAPGQTENPSRADEP